MKRIVFKKKVFILKMLQLYINTRTMGTQDKKQEEKQEENKIRLSWRWQLTAEPFIFSTLGN